MALISIIEDFHPLNSPRLLDRAAQLTPTLSRRSCKPAALCLLRADGTEESVPPEGLPELRRGDSLCLDFGEHLVGYVTLELDCAGSHQDAPAFLSLRFAETRKELEQDPVAFDGWLSRSWIQEETLHVDLLPHRLALPRRYAFRYLRLTVLDTSPKYRLVLRSAECRAVSAVDPKAAAPLASGDALLDRIHAVSLKTLAECMQEEFEDGPKRDRRLWMGDLRLQALTNAVSFRNFDLVKRCLYLFGGTRFPDGRVAANLFTRPVPEADDTFLFDYALMFPVTLEEYLRETGDAEALADLYGIAMEQIDYALGQLDASGRPNAQAVHDCFIDWCDELDKEACALAVLIYALDYALALARRKGDEARIEALPPKAAALRRLALDRYWSEEAGCFVSNGQQAPATQVWMVLADLGDPTRDRRAMEAASRMTGLRMNTPYMHHYYVMALLKAGMSRQAERHLRDYWGSMLDAGADTFWECWDPAEPDQSPYGGLIVNSFCHAWSCTPAYILRRCLRPSD